MERELKFRADDAIVFESLRQADDLGGAALGSPQPAADTDVYLDTAERGILAAGYACRLRLRDGVWQASLKGVGGASGALHTREELTGPASESRSPADWPDSPVREAVLRLASGAPLDELFTLRQARVVRPLAPFEAPPVELSLDDVEVYIAGEPIARYREVEAEQQPGGTDDDLARAGEALAALGLSPEGRSKFQRGLELLDQKPPEAAPARPKSPGVTPDDPLAEAARKILLFHFLRMADREAGARSGADIEDVHAMRVATRRMRAAFRLFGDAFKPKGIRPHREGLRMLATALGSVRDLDVLLEHLLAYQGALEGGGTALTPLVMEWEARRADARAALIAHLDSADYRRFRDRFATFLGIPGSGARADARQVRYHAAAMLWEHYQAVRGYEPVLKFAPIPVLHRLRIDGKRLRYALEFLREVLGPGTPGLIADATAMQDHFGALHDADVAAGLVRDFLMRDALQLSQEERAAIEGYLAARTRELRGLVRRAPRAWRKVGGVGFRRRLGRAIAAL